MLKIKDKTNLCFNRGDEIYLTITLVNETFKAGDKVQMNIVEKEHYENVLFTKDFTVEEEGASYVIHLTSDETRFGETLTKRGKNYFICANNEYNSLIPITLFFLQNFYLC